MYSHNQLRIIVPHPSTGPLSNKPLFYVLASLRFQPWMMLPAKIAEIQDALRDQLPLVNQIVVGSMLISNAAPGGENSLPPATARPTAWAFHALDRSVGCQIAADQLVIHALKYETFEQFASTIRFILSVIEPHIRHFDVGAIGIRYLDKVAPRDGESLSDYMHQEFLPRSVSPSDLEPIGGMSQTLYRTQSGILQARFWTGENYVSVPDDLVPLYLLTQDLSSNLSPLTPLTKGSGILDSDSIWSSPSPVRMNSSDIIEKLRSLHTHSNQFFRSACKPHAYRVWKGEA
jgi:uncharacterized protein (TIGR04255 family)